MAFDDQQRIPLDDASPNRAEAARSEAMVHGLVAGLSIAAGLFLLVRFLHRNGFWIDELYSLHAIHLPFREMVLERLRRGHFPLYFALLKGGVALFGGQASETSMRALSLVFWLAAAASFWAVASRLLSRKAAAVAVTLLALNGLAIRQASEARMYALVLLQSVWITFAYFEMQRGNDRAAWKWIYGAGTVLVFWTSPSFALVSSAFLYDAWRGRRESPALFKTTLITLAVSLLSLAPGLIFHLQTRLQNELAHIRPAAVIFHVVALLGGIFANDHYFRPTRLLMVLQALAGFFTMAVLWRLWQGRKELSRREVACRRIVFFPLGLMLVTWAVEETTGLSVSVLGPARYLMGAVPAGALLTASIVDRWTAGRPRRAEMAQATLAVLLACGAYGILTVITEPFREYALQLRAVYRNGDAIVTVPDQIADGVEMYLPGMRVDAAINRWLLDEREIAERLRPLADRKNVWLLWYRGRRSPVAEVAVRVLGDCQPPGEEKRMGILRLLHFTPADKGAPKTAP